MTLLLRKAAFCVTCLFISLIAASQYNWSKYDSAILNNRYLENTRKELLEIADQSMAAKDFSSYARSIFLQISIADKKTEDTLYFKNSLIIDSVLKTSQASPYLRAIFHLIKAKRLHYFKEKYFSRNNVHLFKSYQPGIEYHNLKHHGLDSLINHEIRLSLEMNISSNEQKPEEFLWLSSNPFIFLFKPAFKDLVYAEWLNMDPGPRTWNGSLGKLLELSQPEFIESLDSINLTYKLYWVGIIRNWIEFQRPRSVAVVNYLETIARRKLLNHISEDSSIQNTYEKYLLSLTRSPYLEVKATSIHQLFNIYRLRAEKYSTENYQREIFYDSSYKLYYKKAIKIVDDNSSVIDSFGFIRQEIEFSKAQFTSPDLSFSGDEINLPEKPILIRATFRNIDQIFLKVYKVNAQFNSDRYLIPSGLSPQVQQIVKLPREVDHQVHRAYIKLDPLPAGKYLIAYSDNPFTSTAKTRFIEITVSNIALINNSEKVFVLNRTTGMPLKDAQVHIKYKIYNNETKGYSIITSPRKKVNSSGFVIVNKENIESALISHHADSIETIINNNYNELPEEIYNKEDYDYLIEYFEENLKMKVFTDRSIYRPGQTVHYKCIFFVTHPKTGRELVLNWRNVKAPLLTKLIYKIALKTSKEKIDVLIEDPFGRTADSLKILPNKYGSYSGTFKISNDATTGEYEFNSDLIYNQSESMGSFKVEEYKRPTFEIILTKPDTELLPGDTIRIQGKVKSFTGSNLNNVKVKYEVIASGSSPKNEQYRKEIVDSGEITTNSEGELKIEFIDSVALAWVNEFSRKVDINYLINAIAVDPTGESRESELDITVSSKNVIIKHPLKPVMEINSLKPFLISTTNIFAGETQKELEITLFRIHKPDHKKPPHSILETDIILYPDSTLRSWLNESSAEKYPQPQEIYRTTYNSANKEYFSLPVDLLTPGNYQFVIRCIENGTIRGETKTDFSLFDQSKSLLPTSNSHFHYLPFNYSQTGETITLYTGTNIKRIYSIYELCFYQKQGNHLKRFYKYITREEQKGLNKFEFIIPKNITGNIQLNHVFLFNNQLYKTSDNIYINEALTNPEIIVEKWRQVLIPGGKERFMVSVKTKERNTAAELMTTLYDASLDRIEPHVWEIPKQRNNLNIYNNWPYTINRNSTRNDFNHFPININSKYQNINAVWWLEDGETLRITRSIDNLAYMLQGKLAGVSVANLDLEEVVVVGYGTKTKRSLTGSLLAIRGSTTLNGYNNKLIILDGIIYEGDISNINTEDVTDAVILKGADATAIYGTRANDGVIILSTKGKVILPKTQEETPVIIRKNFNELGFFFPSLYADRKGFYNIEFTLPESATEWKWKMLAHTKNANFVYAERTLNSILPIIVKPHVPRFLYQGDKIMLNSRILNNDTNNLSGTLKYLIEDLVTGDDITSRLMGASTSLLTINAKSSGHKGFEIKIPEDLIHPIKIRVSMATKAFSDGEEHIIPILSKTTMQRYYIPIQQNKSTFYTLPFNNLPNDAKPLGIKLHIDPLAHASMVHALPFLSTYPYDCAEQTFNKLLAYLIAKKLAREKSIMIARHSNADSLIQPTQAGMEKNPANSKIAGFGEISQNAMPWLNLQNLNTIRQNNLKTLFDTVQSAKLIEQYVPDLIQLQNQDGGMPWFKGGQSNFYISTYLLEGFGKMHNQKMLQLQQEVGEKLNAFLLKLISFADQKYSEQKSDNFILGYISARSYWLQLHPISEENDINIDQLLSGYWKKFQKYDFRSQVELIKSTLATKKEGDLFDLALNNLEAIRQLAITDSINGIRWKVLSDKDDLDGNTEEIVVKLAEAFEQTGTGKETISGIIKWLLTARNEHRWSTTKTTGEVINLLHRNTNELLQKPLQLSAKFDDEKLVVSNDLNTGELQNSILLNGKPFPDSIYVEVSPKDYVLGGLSYYYFSADHSKNQGISGVTINRRYIISNNGDKGRIFDGNSILENGDKIKVILTIKTDRQLEFVHIMEKHPASFEPVDGKSGYEYKRNLSYYKSVKDEGHNFFAERIPSGITTIEYEMQATHSGTFIAGPAKLQCMYSPAILVYSNSIQTIIK